MRLAIERLLALRGWSLALLCGAVLAAAMWLAFSLAAVSVSQPAPAPLKAQWRRVLPLRATLQQRVVHSWTARRFSPLEPPVAGVTLQTWQPRGRGGEMHAVVDWQAVPPLFAWLADCAVHPGAFSLNGEKGTLQLSLQLVRDDEA